MSKALTVRQREAVEAPVGPVRVFAGAGSGKTTVLTMRYAKLLRGGADGKRVMVCTFSKAAALEMRERLESGLGMEIPKYAWIGTIHACFYRILREELGSELRVLTDSGFKDKRTEIWHDGRITILVSHRFSTVRMADLIVVLDGAKLVEFGTHAALMAKGGQYAELYGIQAAAYR